MIAVGVYASIGEANYMSVTAPPAPEPAPAQGAPGPLPGAPTVDPGITPRPLPPAPPAAAPGVSAAPAAAPPIAPPAADPAQVEALVAAIGIAPFLARNLRKVWMHHMDRAAKVGEEIDRKIYLFINRESPAESAPLSDFNFEEVRADIQRTPTPQHTQDIIDAFGDLPDAGLAATLVYERIQAYLVTKVPKRVHQSIAGPVLETPAHSDLARFRRTWNVACDPLSILDDLNEFALSRDMVQALVDMFPLTWQRMKKGVDDGLTRKKSVELNYRLTIRKEQLLRILIQDEDVTSKAMGVALQAQFAANAAAAAPKPAKPPLKTVGGGEASAADRIGQV